MRYLPKGSESWKWNIYWKVHKFQKPPQPNPNYMSEKWKLNLSKVTQVYSVLFLSVLSILCSNYYWVHLLMARGELVRVDIKQSGSWVVLWRICWTCAAADFSSRHVIFMSPFFLTSISSSRQHTCLCASLCEISIFATWASYLHPHCTIVLGVLCTFSDNLDGPGLHQHRGPIPSSMEGNYDLVFSLCSSDYSFSTSKLKFG